MHHGLFSSSFVTPFLAMVGLTSARSDRFWRSTLIDAARTVLRTPALHRKFATMNGESSVVVLREALKLHHDPHPWDDIWRAMAVEHPLRDEWWDERDLQPLLDRVEVPDLSGVRLAERAAAPAVDLPGAGRAHATRRSCGSGCSATSV